MVTFLLSLRVSEILPLMCSSTPLFSTPPLVSPVHRAVKIASSMCSQPMSSISLCFVRYAINGECHLYQSTAFSADTCKNINGTYVEANQTCYYHEFRCPYYTVGGQCHSSVSCDRFSCQTCLVYGGYYEPNRRWLVHNASMLIILLSLLLILWL